MISTTENSPSMKERFYSCLQGVFLGTSVTYFTNYVFILIPYVGPFLLSLPATVGYVSGALNGSCNMQWLCTPPPVDLPKTGKLATALTTTALASIIIGFSCKNFFDEDPDPALSATVQTIASGSLTYVLRAAVLFMFKTAQQCSWTTKNPLLKSDHKDADVVLDIANKETDLPFLKKEHGYETALVIGSVNADLLPNRKTIKVNDATSAKEANESSLLLKA